MRASWRPAGAGVALVACLTGVVPSAVAAEGQVGTPALLATGKELVLRSSDLPRGWTSDDDAGECMDGSGPSSSAAGCSTTGVPRQQASDDKFAQCLGLPVSHVSMLTWKDEPGEPFTYLSPTFTAPGYSGLYQVPTLASAVTIEPSAAVQGRDLAAFSQPSFPRCFKVQEAWQMLAIAEQLGSARHVSMAFGPVHRVPEEAATGVTAVGYTVSFTLRSPQHNVSALFAWVILGAGRAEEVLKATSASAAPMPAAAVVMALGHLEGRLAAYAAR